MKTRHAWAAAGAAVLLSACGGGGGAAGTGSPSGGGSSQPKPYVEPSPLPSAKSAERLCLAPRAASLIDPFTGQPYGDKPGTLDTEKQWVRSYVNDTYLWYQDVVGPDPALFKVGGTVSYTTPATNRSQLVTMSSSYDVLDTYFNSLRTFQITASGAPKDQFHFTYLTTDWVNLSTAGSSVGFGFQLAFSNSSSSRSAVVAYVNPGTPAAAAGMDRGMQILSVNGVAVSSSNDVGTLNEGLFYPQAGKSYTFGISDASGTRSITLTAAQVVSAPVQRVQTLPAPNNMVGYLQFNDHIAPAEGQLIAAVQQLKAANGGAGISDLALDLRYNGGGLLDIASELAYMVAGAQRTQGKTFERENFNDKNPFGLSVADATTPFLSQSQGYSAPPGQQLPQLGLGRVFVLTGPGTCSASEAIINGLNGVGVQVVLIGSTTCGKPYGFLPQDNCGVTYFTIQFKGVNQAGFGDYADGFVPGGSGSPANRLPGCVVADDLDHALGDPREAQLATALQYRATGSCAPAAAALGRQLAQARPAGDLQLVRGAARENRLYRPRAGQRD